MHCPYSKPINTFVLCCSSWCYISWLIRFQSITCFSLTTLTTPIIRYDSSAPACLTCTDPVLEHSIMYAVYKVVAGQCNKLLLGNVTSWCWASAASLYVASFCGCGSTHGGIMQCCCPTGSAWYSMWLHIILAAFACISFCQHLHAFRSGSTCVHIVLAAFACISSWHQAVDNPQINVLASWLLTS